MLFDRDHLLLRDEAVPAAERLGVVGGVGVIGRHVGAHDARGVAGDVEAAAELVLGAHAGAAFTVDPVPAPVLVADEPAGLRPIFGVTPRLDSWLRPGAFEKVGLGSRLPPPG